MQREELGMDPTIVKLFARTHRLRGKPEEPGVDRKSQQIYISYSR